MSDDLLKDEMGSALGAETNSTSELPQSHPRRRRPINGRRMQMRGTQEAKQAAALKNRRGGGARERRQLPIKFPAAFAITAAELEAIDLVMGDFVRRLLKEE